MSEPVQGLPLGVVDVLDSLPAHVAIVDASGCIRAVNSAWRQYARDNAPDERGAPQSTDVGASYLEICRAAEAEEPTAREVADGIEAVLHGETPSFKLDYPCHCPSGEQWFMVQVTPLGPPGTAVLVAHHKVTARKGAVDEAKRRGEHESLAQYRASFEQAGTGITHTGVDGRFLRVNAQFSHMLGYEPDELIGVRVEAITHPEDRPYDAESRRRILARDFGPAHYEKRYLHRSGAAIWASVTKSLRRAEHGEPLHFISVVEDVQERKGHEAALRESEERLRIALQAAGAIAFFWDAASDSVTRFYSTEPALPTNIGSPEPVAAVRARVHPDDRDAFDAGVEACIVRGGEYRNLYRIVRPDGSTRWLEEWGSLERDAAGAPLRLTGVSVDVTDRRRTERALRGHNQVLELIAAGMPLQDTLEAVVRLVEEQLPGGLCSVLVAHEGRLRFAAGAGLPAAYNRAVDGVPIGPAAGSCGTAAFRGKTVVVTDIANDPLWADYRAVALEHGLRSCLSVPILSSGNVTGIERGQVLGTFALYRRDVGDPDPLAFPVLSGAQRLAREAIQLRGGPLPAVAGAAQLAGVAIERERAEHALRESQERFHSVLDHSPTLIHLADLSGRYVFVNRRMSETMGVESSACLGRLPHEIFPGTLAEQSEQSWRRVLETAEPVQVEETGTTPAGRRITLLTVRFALRNADGQPYLVCGISTDITERKRAEQALKLQSEVLDRMTEGVSLTADDGTIVYANPAEERMFGYEPGGLVGKNVAVQHDGSRERVAERDAAHAAVHRYGSWRGQMISTRLDGTTFESAVHLTSLEFDDGARYCVRVQEDVTDRKEAQAERDRLWNDSPDPVCVAGLDGRFRQVNPAWGQKLGWSASELLQTPWMDLVHPSDREVMEQGRSRLSSGSAVRAVSMRMRAANGAYRWFSWNAIPLPDGARFYGFARDVTEEKELQEQFWRAQKMEAVGQLAGGVAHDFNNLLTIINGYADLLLEDRGHTDLHTELIQDIRDAGERAASLTAQLLAFSRKAIVEPKPLDVDASIETASRMLERLIGEDVRLVRELGAHARVLADPVQLEQVLMNLAVNARDAMPRGGRLTLRTSEIELGEALAIDSGELPPGRYVEIRVMDTGVGMSEQVRARVFEPFFTTKGPGLGTGLGLATVYGIVSQAGGSIWVESQPDKGSSFRILLPAIVAPATPLPRASGSVAACGNETILVAEDEEAVRTLVRRALERQGYVVLEARGATEALEVAHRHQGQIHLLLTDVVMPDRGGREVADAIRAQRPGIRVLYMSGYTDDAVVKHGIEASTDSFIQKPFTPSHLSRKVRNILDES